MKIDSLPMNEQLRMIKGVDGITQKSQQVKGPGTDGQAEGVGFGDLLVKQLGNVNDLGLEAESAIKDQILGNSQNAHTALLAVQKADISFRLLLSIKQKVEQAYQQLIRTQI